MRAPTKGMLNPYRILDLTDEKGFFCGKVLGDLGADVIKIEPPGGSQSRSLGPFYHDDPSPEKSLFWFAYNANKRGITLNIETNDGQEIFKRLIKKSDVIIESFSPRYLDSIGLGYRVLKAINHNLILVSISPFGHKGPYKNFKTSDIVAWAMGGYMLSTGPSDRPPVRISHVSHAFLHAGAEAAVGAMMALLQRRITGKGQQVNVSIQQAVAQSVDAVTWLWDMQKVIRPRGKGAIRPDLKVNLLWPCKDGYVCWTYWFGLSGAWNMPLIRWMAEEGVDVEFLKNFDWEGFDWKDATQELIDRIAAPTLKFFSTRTKAELLEGALKYRAQLYPVSNVSEILSNVQLASRGYWVEVEHPELGITITYPGAFAKTTQSPPRLYRRAPLIGEHNIELYQEELGMTCDELIMLKQAGVI